MELSERQSRLRDEFREARGYWTSAWETLLELDPDFFEAYFVLSAVPWRTGCLEPKVKEFVYIAVDAATTHLYEPGIRIHIRKAIEHGATREELMEVLELTSTMGIHAATVGVPVLLDVLDETGRRDGAPPLTDRQRRIKAEFEAKRGYWNEFWDGFLELDEDFFEAYVRFSALPWTQGVLEPKVKELIYTAFDASATHMYVPGLRQHVVNALEHGATPGEIMEVFELASIIGIHTCATAVPILVEELERAGGEAAR
jgi:alkylhydroperoxidase/carboxymuconolactone decarboxylase family protein YurZ